MAAVMIGIDPHKASHTAVAINAAEEPLGQLRVRASASRAGRLPGWAQAWPRRTWAVEGAGGVGRLPDWQLPAAGGQVLDVPPKLAARVRLLQAGDTNKNDPDDAFSVAVAALRSPGVREAQRDDHAAVLKIWSKRHKDLSRTRTQVACRPHAVLRAGARRRLQADHRRAGRADPGIDRAARGGGGGPLRARGSPRRGSARHRRGDPRDQEDAHRRGPGHWHRPDRAVRGGAGDRRRGDRRRPRRVRFPSRDRFAAYHGTAPIEVSSGGRTIWRLSRRGNRRHGHAIHMAAVTQIRHRHTKGRACYDKRPAAGKTGKEAPRAQTPDQRRHLRLPARRRPARRGEEPGRATGEPPCHQGGRRTPRPPALRASHSRACRPAYDPCCSLSRAAAISCERAAGSRAGRSPDAQRRPQGVLDAAANEPIMPAAGKEGRTPP